MNIVFQHNGRFWLYKTDEAGWGHPAWEITHVEALRLCREKSAEYRKGFWPPEGVAYQ